MSERGYYDQDNAPFLYEGGEPVVPGGMDCLQLRHPTAGPFHYLISEQAKSLVALQELQHEVGALLEFRDLVMETFPNLRTKLAQSTPNTMTSHHHHHHTSNIPVSIRPGDWTPGVRVRKKIGSAKDESRNSKKNGDIAVQDSGFSTETSSKETHSASSTAPPPSSTAPGGTESDEVEDELWNLLDVIHRKGTRLKREAEALQGTLREQGNFPDEGGCPRGELFRSSADDVRQLRQERDVLLDKLAEMEAEVLAGRVHTTRLQEDLENLLSTKHDLEEQLKAVVMQRGEVNSRIHDLHLQFVTKSNGVVAPSSPSDGKRLKYPLSDNRKDPTSSQRTANRKSAVGSELDSVLGDKVLPKVKVPESRKIAAILREHDPLVLQKHLLTTTVQNQVLKEKVDSAVNLEMGLRDELNKYKEENEDLKFQLEDKNIELEGTRARIRILEDFQRPNQKPISPDIIPATESPSNRPSSRTEITSSSMKNMGPLPVNLQMDHSSSTESAHDQAEKDRKDGGSVKQRRPSKIPLKSYTAPKPPGGKHSPAPGTRSRSGDSPGRPHSAQSWRNRSEGNSLKNSPCNNNNNGSLPKSRNSSLISARDSLSSKLRSSDSLLKLATSPSPNSFKESAATPKKSGAPRNPSNTAVATPTGQKDEKITNSSSANGKSPCPWTLSSYNSEPDLAFCPDSLDRNRDESLTETSSGHRFQTANTFLWNVPGPRGVPRDEFYDSIDSNVLSDGSFYRPGGEELAECDSLERHLSDFSDRK